MAAYTIFPSKRTKRHYLFTFWVMGVLGILLIFIIYIRWFSYLNPPGNLNDFIAVISRTNIPITTEGTIQSGAEKERLEIVLFMQTPQANYYLIDDTDEVSRTQKAHSKYCPAEGTIDCYIGERVQISGFLTNKSKRIVYLGAEGSIHAQELIVKEFNILE